MVEANWPPDMDSDVDLWVQAPGDMPVGYSNKGGAVFNLLRDDLGQQLDLSGLNYESSYSRGIVPGEYTVNLHLYRNRAGHPGGAGDGDRQHQADVRDAGAADPDEQGRARPRGPGAHRVPLQAHRGRRPWCPAASTACSDPCARGPSHDRPALPVRAGGVLAAVLASIAIWAPRRLAGQAPGALACTVAVHAAGLCRLQRPAQPPQAGGLEWWLGQADEATVLGAQMREGREPLSLAAARGRARAARLPPALEPADGRSSCSRRSRRRSATAPRRGCACRSSRRLDRREPKFYAPPQPALPPKDLAQPPAQVYEQPGENA